MLPAPPEMDFLFARHAQAVSNQKKIIPIDACCEGLTTLGRQQVLQGITALKKQGVRLRAVFSSPVLRAGMMAEMIAGTFGCDVIFIAEIAEQNLGDWSGRPWAEVQHHFASRTEPPAGETFVDFYARTCRGLWRIKQHQDLLGPRPSDAIDIVVSHGGVWHAIKALYRDFAEEWPPNGAIGHLSLRKDGFALQPVFIPSGSFASSAIGVQPVLD